MARTSGKRITTKKQTVASEESPVAFGDYVAPKFVGEALASDDTSIPKRGRLRLGPNSKIDFPNISNISSPFANGGSTMDASEPARLCQKAYWGFPLLRNTIDVMTELTNSRVYLLGGSQKQRDFIGAWWDRIGLWQFKEQFFREFYRSGTVPIYRFDGEYNPKDLTKMTQVFGAMDTKTVPVRYIILNPVDIRVGANITFDQPLYYKVLSNYELERIRNPKNRGRQTGSKIVRR